MMTGRTQTSMAIERLRSDIVTGKLRPNEKLRVQPLADRYGLAASSLREALSRLVTDALVVAEDQRGFRVSPVSRENLMDLTETRVGIEGLALRRAIEFGTVAWESEIIGAHHRLASARESHDPNSDELLRWAAYHAEFHRALIGACRSEWLLSFCRLLYAQSERYRMLATFTRPRGARDARREHRELMDAAIARNADGACALLGQHYRETTRLLLENGVES